MNVVVSWMVCVYSASSGEGLINTTDNAVFHLRTRSGTRNYER